MNFFQNVLAKAKKEGKLDPSLLPWEGSTWEVQNIQKESAAPARKAQAAAPDPAPQRKGGSFIAHLQSLSPEVLYDYQKIIENIRGLVQSDKTYVLGISSALPGQGTSTMASVLSLLAAGQSAPNSPKRQSPGVDAVADGNGEIERVGTLLIDMQVFQPSLHKIFGLPNEYGICDHLSGNIPLNVSMNTIPGFNLKIIPAGNESSFHYNQSHMLKMKSLLTNLRLPYEFVILDIPPILQHAEAIALSKLCDGVVLVVGSGQLRPEEVKETRMVLEKASVNVLGGILNRQKSYLPKGLSGRI